MAARIFNSFMPGSSKEAALAFHTATRLQDGKLSLIDDPGAFASLIGSDLARECNQRAVDDHQPVDQLLMPVPLDVGGVGEGSQQCKDQMKVTFAVPHADGQAHLHTLQAPIVEGSGKLLPGLLGLDLLEHNKAIVDIGG